MTLNKTIVEEQAEAPQLYANTSSTGKRYGQAIRLCSRWLLPEE